MPYPNEQQSYMCLPKAYERLLSQRIREMQTSCGSMANSLYFGCFSDLFKITKETFMHIDAGNTGFMLLCTILVMLMTPGLAFFYGGLVGPKNVLTIMMQSFVSMGWTTVLWYAFGYSLCFSDRRAFST